MKKHGLAQAFTLVLVFLLSGCVVRSYTVTRDRVDQDTAIGNRGYLMGNAPAEESGERKKTRTTRVVEIEMRSPLKFEKAPEKKAVQERVEPVAPLSDMEEEVSEGNRGYMMESTASEEIESMPKASGTEFQKYTVAKNDTLQKISQKFFGTTKKWRQIYELNSDVLKGPDKIRPGQVLKVPVSGQPMKEIPENLK